MEKDQQNKKNEVLNFISDILAMACVGIIVDYFAKTDFIFTLIGAVLGLCLAFFLRSRRKKMGGDTPPEKTNK